MSGESGWRMKRRINFEFYFRLIRNFEVQWHYGEMQYGSNTFLNAPAGELKFRFVDFKE